MPSVSFLSAYFVFASLCFINLTHGLKTPSPASENALMDPLFKRRYVKPKPQPQPQPQPVSPLYSSWRELETPEMELSTESGSIDQLGVYRTGLNEVDFVQAVYTAQRWAQVIDLKQPQIVETYRLSERNPMPQILLYYRNLQDPNSSGPGAAPLQDENQHPDVYTWFRRIRGPSHQLKGVMACGELVNRMQDVPQDDGTTTQTETVEPVYQIGYVVGMGLTPLTEVLERVPTEAEFAAIREARRQSAHWPWMYIIFLIAWLARDVVWGKH
ncbi:MAG: hypothetical protein M1837_005758 [Sclerophora amabilis]|nr:MAG: hypothetical protein M1837_005758 [Sclerophora amabilis]